MGETLSDLGEFGLIERLLARIPTEGAEVVVGPGDDAAVLRIGDRELIATTDMSVEGRHFDLRFSTSRDVGWKAMMVNVSDIAAMGGLPRWALVSVGAPAATHVEQLEALYDGLAEAARAAEVLIVGGDTVAAEALVISISLLGEPGPGGVVRRSGAQDGDLLCVTGPVGAAAAGLALLRGTAEGDEQASAFLDEHPHLAEAHRRPRARVAEGLALAKAGARAMIDVSDGLRQDAGHLGEASGVGVTIDDVPRAAGVAAVEEWAGREIAASGGDDYELLVAIAPEAQDEIRATVPSLQVIGSFGGDPTRPSGGWNSFD